MNVIDAKQMLKKNFEQKCGIQQNWLENTGEEYARGEIDKSFEEDEDSITILLCKQKSSHEESNLCKKKSSHERKTHQRQEI